MPHTIESFLDVKSNDSDFVLGVQSIIPPLSDVGEHVNCRPLLTKTILGVAQILKLMLTKVAADVGTDETLHKLRYYGQQ